MHKHGTVRTYEQNTLALFAAIVLAAGWCGFKIGARSPTTRSSAAASVSFQDDDGTDLMVPSVVVVTAMHSELERWIDRLPLGQTLGTELWWNGTLGILGMVTGEGMRSAAISATALGYDNRFDVRSSYWMFAGIAGVDPAAGSIGSAFWAEAIIHADAGNMFDAREIPASFNGTTILPSNRDLPFGAPPPTDAEVKSQGGIVYNISSLANYAYNVTRSIVLPDDASLLAIRAAYEEGTPARMPPSVRLGNVVSSNLFWAVSTFFLFNTIFDEARFIGHFHDSVGASMARLLVGWSRQRRFCYHCYGRHLHSVRT